MAVTETVLSATISGTNDRDNTIVAPRPSGRRFGRAISAWLTAPIVEQAGQRAMWAIDRAEAQEREARLSARPATPPVAR